MCIISHIRSQETFSSQQTSNFLKHVYQVESDGVDGQQKLRAPKGQTIASVSAAGKPVALSAQADGTVTFAARAGQSYVVRF